MHFTDLKNSRGINVSNTNSRTSENFRDQQELDNKVFLSVVF